MVLLIFSKLENEADLNGNLKQIFPQKKTDGFPSSEGLVVCFF
jgi:hypothetical protein